MEVETGGTLGPYRLGEKLGEGGMGIVFRAIDERDGTVVALKILRHELSQDGSFERRFIHEARTAGEVQHPHLTPILDSGEVGGRHYLAVAFVEGSTLAERIRQEGPLAPDDILRIVAEVGAGLDALHRAQLVHRDVKPSNIMLRENGTAVLTDFGLAKGPAYTVLTKPGQVLGTLDYLAPELIRGLPASSSSDIYALGCVVFECTAGAAPFAGVSSLRVGLAHLETEPPDPCAARDDLPPAFSRVVLQAMAKDPADRPTTATAYARMLRVAAGLGST